MSHEWIGSEPETSNLLDLADQGIFLGERAAGTTALLQCVWVYNRSIDIDALKKFHEQLQRGLLSRCVERSPLPFGRHRWVTPMHLPAIEIVEVARPREALDTWLDEQAATPLDPERGPGWHLAALPLTDGGTGVSLVVSHCLADGLGLCEVLVDATSGRDELFSLPPAGARRRRRAVLEDARQSLRDAPAVSRALVATARFARQDRDRFRSTTPLAVPAPTGPATPNAAQCECIALPTTTIFVDADEWDARAKQLGGTSNSLLTGFAARLAQRRGRVTAGGSVALALPVSDRRPADTRANAVTNVDLIVDPGPVTTDLSRIRSAIKQALARHAEVPDGRTALLPLVPLLPRWLARRLLIVATGGPTSVVASNLGAIDPATTRVDGTDADYFALQSLFPGVARSLVHRTGGRLALASGRVHGRVFISIIAYQQGRSNSNDELRRDVSGTLADFSLVGTTGWGSPLPVSGAS